jgi:hypothetical protein
MPSLQMFMIADQSATLPTGRPVPPLSMRNDTSESIPKVVSIRASEGPADYVQEYGPRRAAPPVVITATDSSGRQPLPTVQVLQQTHAYDKQPRDAPRTTAQLDPPDHVSATHVSTPQPWAQPVQWSTEPQPLSPAHRPPVVPSPMVFPTPLAPASTPMDAQQNSTSTPPRSTPNGLSSYQESHPHARENPWHNPTGNGRPPIPPVHSHTVPSPMAGGGQRASPKGTSPMVHDVAGSKHSRYSSVPSGYVNVQPSYLASPPSRPIAPDLAAAFPIREDNTDTYRHASQAHGERSQSTQPSKDTFDHWSQHGHNQDITARMVVSTVPSNERTPRSAKASPSLHPRPVNQGTPPKPPLQPITAPAFPTQSSTNPDVLHAHDSSHIGVYNMTNQNSNSSQYPATFIYPSSLPRTQIETHSAINNLPVASAPSNTPSPKMKSGNPSPRSRSQVVAPSQGPTPPVAVHIATRTPSHETGSTTLLGQTPSSQGSGSMQLPMSPPAHPQPNVPRVTNHGSQQIVHPSVPVSDNLGDRNANASSHTQYPTTRQTSARHHHSNSAPVVAASSPALPPPPVRSQTHPPPRVPAPVSPVPIRSYLTTQAIGDLQIVRMPVPGYSTSASNHKQQRPAIPSPSQESDLHTPSSLAFSTKLPIVSDEPLVPVMSTQSFQEPKKKAGFFQGLGLFRSKSSAQKRHPHESKIPDPRAQTTTATATKTATSKPSVPLHYDSDSRVVTAPSRLKKMKAAHTPVPSAASHATQPRPPPTPVPVPAPSVAAAPEKRFSSVPNGFGSFRIPSKRYRTMSGASAEAVDGTNAGVCLLVFYFS